MVDWIAAHQEILFLIWLSGAVLMAVYFGTVAEMNEANGEKAPGLLWSTAMACMWPFGAAAALAYMLANLYRLFRG